MASRANNEGMSEQLELMEKAGISDTEILEYLELKEPTVE